MCGIFASLNIDAQSESELAILRRGFAKGKNRGPESSTWYDLGCDGKASFGFHRLAINGLNDASNQPFFIRNCILICNGEIYNFEQLFDIIQVSPRTGSDCEIIIHLYLQYGMQQTLAMLDGVFAFVLVDLTANLLFVARDPFGVRPLYCLTRSTNHKRPRLQYHFASELKCLVENYVDAGQQDCLIRSIRQFTPATFSTFTFASGNGVSHGFLKKHHETVYFMPTISHFSTPVDYKQLLSQIAYYLNNAVSKRCLATERPIACLVSGGVDSTLIAALVNNFYKLNGIASKLETYSIGLEGSVDLEYGAIAAEYLDTQHTIVTVSGEDMFNAIPEVIRAIESYDTTTVRASIGNYLLGKFIAANSEAKVIFNGDGADELLGGYLYMNMCPDDIAFDQETRRLLKDIHLFDVLRSDKSISSHGLEPRTPFLDKSFVNFILSIPPHIRNHLNCPGKREKHLLREAFHKSQFINFEGKQIIPDEILWRKKEAFSDGVCGNGSHEKSLFQILQTHIAAHLNETEGTDTYTACIETEKYYYAKLFEEAYPGCADVVPYFWMPQYTTSTNDPSARTLPNYST